MFSEDERTVLKGLLGGLASDLLEAKIARLREIVEQYRLRMARRSASPRIGQVLSQLAQIESAAARARRGRDADLPDEILPETFDALAGRYPFSNLDLARVTLTTLSDSSQYASVRTAVVNASIASHVLRAAQRQNPREAHLVAARCWSFPFSAAEKYFFADLTGPASVEQRRRLEQFVQGGPSVAREFVRHVEERVRSATRDPCKQNTGARLLYDWAEPAPLPRLVLEVVETVLGPRMERPNPRERDRVIDIVNLMINAGRPATLDFRDVREDVVSSALTVWLALHQHRAVLDRLSATMDEVSNANISLPWRRRWPLLWLETYRAAVLQSCGEVWRRAAMGDLHDLGKHRSRQSLSKPAIGTGEGEPPVRGVSRRPRATGSPLPFLDLAQAAAARSEFTFRQSLKGAVNAWRGDPAHDDFRPI